MLEDPIPAPVGRCARCAHEFTMSEPDAKHCSRTCARRMTKWRRQVRDGAVPCPTPDKVGRYESLAVAWEDALRRHLFAYRCICGQAHVTRKPKRLPEWAGREKAPTLAAA
jgi:hypothetical protein